MKKYYYKNLNTEIRKALLRRPSINFDGIFNVVKPIINDVKQNGLQAALKYAKEFDGFGTTEVKVSPAEFDEAEENLDDEIKQALKTAAANIEKFHIEQILKSYSVETMPGIICSREFRAIENVGLYVPGGSAVLPSTMLMLGIPAKIAGCKRVVVCSPAKNGRINYPLLYAAKLCGIDEFYKLGGAQAIALMALGDVTIPKVDKIFGPGNQFVTAAKMLISIDPDGCAIDMPAGPSELLIIADETANPAFVAADLLSQAEHGEDSQVVLVSTSEKFIEQVNSEIAGQIQMLPRKAIAEKSFGGSFILITENIEQAIEFSNEYAPEHLIINLENSESNRDKIINAGSVFFGQYSPESVGDYASGTNHSLPTSGYAKSFGGVTVESFMKSITFQHLTKEGLKQISSAVETIAEAEGLEAHKNAVTIRFKE
jgi:histidinol dehydrogenase